MARSNTANGGSTYVDLDIQTVSAGANTYVVRAVVYLTSPNVVDSGNNLSVGGNWSRSGALGLSGAYSHSPVWYQDISVGRAVGSNTTVNVSFSWSGVEYWGTTLSASNSYVVPMQDLVPLPPGISHSAVTASSVGITVTAADGRGHGIDAYATYVLTNNAWPFGGGNIVSSAAGGSYFATGLVRATGYFYTSRAHNSIGWSAWAAMRVFTTLPVVPTMATTYTAGSLTRNSAIISGLSVTDTGGAAPSNVRAQYNTVASATGASVVTQGSWNNITVSGLAALTTYYYRCAAYNSAGWSAYPATWESFTTLADAPNDMAAPTFSTVDDTSMRVSWVAPAMNGATFVAYSYEISLTNTFASLVTSGTTAALYVDLTGLIPGTRYYARVRANATPNNGGYGVANQLMTGFVPNSGLRVYACIDGTIHQGDLYTFVGGVRKQLAPMYAHDGVLETE